MDRLPNRWTDYHATKWTEFKGVVVTFRLHTSAGRYGAGRDAADALGWRWRVPERAGGRKNISPRPSNNFKSLLKDPFAKKAGGRPVDRGIAPRFGGNLTFEVRICLLQGDMEPDEILPTRWDGTGACRSVQAAAKAFPNVSILSAQEQVRQCPRPQLLKSLELSGFRLSITMISMIERPPIISQLQ